MAADESRNDDSCIFDPNFAIICSFFEKFSTLCGIKQHTFTELQEMIDSAEEISPHLIDLHIRLMRKAKKNVNPDRWQRTLAKFCYFTLPNDCWDLEQHGYKHLNRSQRLRILLALIEAQFDHNVKFKNDVNKLLVNELRLTPFGKDKNGCNYWLHVDQDLNLKIYKEDIEEEEWELIVQNREELEKLIDNLMKERDPNRKLDDIEEEDEDEDDDENNDEEENNSPIAKSQNEEFKETEKSDKTPLKNQEPAANFEDNEISSENKHTPVNNTAAYHGCLLTKTVVEQQLSNDEKQKEVLQLDSKLQQLIGEKIAKIRDQPLTKDIPELSPKQKRRNTPTTVKPLDKNTFAEHLRKLESQNMLQPLLSDEPFFSTDALLKSKISQKLNLIAPVLHADLKKSELNAVDNAKSGLQSKITKPGLKLEQILKSKLAQKLAANNPPSDVSSGLKSEVDDLSTDKEMLAGETCHVPQESTIDQHEFQPSVVEAPEALKRQHSDDTKCESKKPKLADPVDEEEIEEPVMLITGVGSGRDCDTGNDEIGSEKNENSAATHLTHKVEDILKHSNAEQEMASTSEDTTTFSTAKSEPETLEKKKPKLWTIDAICNTDSKETKARSDDVSLFPNYNFNKDHKKSSENSLFRPAETYSIFSLSANTNNEREAHSVSVTTNFYFGCNNQNPCFLPAERSVNSFKSHNVKDIVENLDARGSETNMKISNFDVESLCAKNIEPSITNSAVDLHVHEKQKPIDRESNVSSGSNANSLDSCNNKIMNEKPVKLKLENRVKCENEKIFENTDTPVNLSDKFETEESAIEVNRTDPDMIGERTKGQKLEVKDYISVVDQLDNKETLHSNAVNTIKKQEEIEGQADEVKGEIVTEQEIKSPKSNIFSSESEVTVINRSNILEESVYQNKLVTGDDSLKCSSIFNESQNLPEKETAPVSENIACSTDNTTEFKEADSTSPNEISKSQNDSAVEAEPCEHLEEHMNASDQKPSTNEQKSVIETEIGNSLNELPVSISENAAVNKNVSVDNEGASNFDSYVPPTVGTESDKPLVHEVESNVVVHNEENSQVEEKIIKKSNDIISSEKISKYKLEPETIKENTSEPSAEIDISREFENLESHTNITADAVEPNLTLLSHTEISKMDENYTCEEQNKTPQMPPNENNVSGKSISLCPQLDKSTSGILEEARNKLKENVTAQNEEEPKVTDETTLVEPVSAKGSIEQNESTAEVDDNSAGAATSQLFEQDTQSAVPAEETESATDTEKNDFVVESLNDSALETKSGKKQFSEENSESPSIGTKLERKGEESKTEKPPEEEVPPITTRISTRWTRSAKSHKNDDNLSTSLNVKTPKKDEQPKEEENKYDEIQTPFTRSLRKSTQSKKEETETTPKMESKWGKKGKNQTSKLNDVEKEVSSENLDTKWTRKVKNQASKMHDGRKEEALEMTETRSKRKGKSQIMKASDAIKKEAASNAEPRLTRKGKIQKTEELGEGAEKLTKKSKNQSSKINEVDSSETAETRSTRKGKSHVSKVDTEKEEPASTSKVTRKSKNHASKLEDSIKEGSPDNVRSSRKCRNQEPAETKYSKKNKNKSQQMKENAEEEGEGSLKAEGDDGDKNASDEVTQSKKVIKLKNEVNDNESELKPQKKKRTLKRGWLHDVDVSNIEVNDGPSNIRQSRRIAQLKIREQAELKFAEQKTPKKATPTTKSKPGSAAKKNNKTPVKKSSKYKPSKEESDEGSTYEKPISSSKKKKKKEIKKNFDMRNAWKANSDSSSEEEEDEDHFYEEEEELAVNDASDHEFSPESDINDDEDYMPVKRARTAHSKPVTKEDQSARDDLNCQHCSTADQPEWILLCDACDEGWHASCLKPPLLSIPEGDWFCPPCQHNKLINSLQRFLKGYEKSLKKRANEELRKKRLEYVGISFSNILLNEQTTRKEKMVEKPESEKTGDSDEYTNEESDDEPSYKLRIRRQVNVSRRLNEYDELMNMAIQREDTGYVQISNETTPIKPAEVPSGEEPSETTLPEADDSLIDGKVEENEEVEQDDDDTVSTEKVVPPVVLQLRNIRKKPPRLTKLDVSSDDDHFSDEDFKGSSIEENEDEDEYAKSETDSDEIAYRRGREPIRRSTRARVTRYDKDFINDDSEDDNEEEYDRKKRKRRYSDSDSEGDSTWGKRRRSKASQSWKSKKKRRRIMFEGDSDEERKKPRKSKVQYGLDESEDDYPQRRTRGRKINYVENLGSDSEEDSSRRKKKVNKIISDDEEYVNDEDENVANSSKESGPASENEEKSEPESDAETSAEKVIISQKPAAGLDSEASDLSISPIKNVAENSDKATASKTDFTNIFTVATQQNEIPKETVIGTDQNSIDIPCKKKKAKKSPKKESPMYSGTMTGDSKFVIKKVDTNPSLERMQSMAQHLTETKATPPFSAASVQETKYPASISVSNAVMSVKYADVGISYEDPDKPENEDKFARPIRVVSPSKLYAIQQEGQQQLNRPSPPFAMAPRMQPPMLGTPPGPMMLPRSMGNSMSMRGPISMQPSPRQGPPMQGSPRQGSPMQGPPMQGSPRQGPPIPGPPAQGLPMQGSPVQGLPMQASSVQGPPMQGSLMQGSPMTGPLSRHPPPNVSVSQCPPIPGSPSTEPVSRRGRRGRGKKQLEQERLEREAMEAARGEEMMPLHMLKLPTSEMNAPRPPGHYGPPGRPQFAPYANVPRMPFSQAPPSTQTNSTTVTMGNTPKRVKITPTRMRMPNPAQNVMRFPRPPVTAPMYVPHPHDTSPSGVGTVVTSDNKITSIPRITAASTMPVKSEGTVSPSTVKLDHADQYYHATSYNPSQLPRGYNPRPEFTFVRNPMPPMYRQLQPVSSLPSVAPATGFTRPSLNHGPYPSTSSVISGPISSSSNTTSPNVKPEVTSTSSAVPQSYPPQFTPNSLPPTTSPVSVKSNQNAVSFATPSRTSPPGPPNANPPTPVYSGVHVKQLPPPAPQSSAPSVPYPAPYYTTPTSVPGTYATAQPSQLPPVSTFGPPGSRAAPPPPHIPFKPPTPTTSQADPSASSHSTEYLASTTQSPDFQFSETPPLSTGSEAENRSGEFENSFDQSSSYEEEQPPAEETSGEFGGLVSYFSSQHEDDLDT